MNKLYDTLVLNKVYIPIHVIGYKRCMSLIYQDNAKSLDKNFMPYAFKDWVEYSSYPEVLDDGYAMINTVKHKIAIPDIIVLTAYDRLPRREIKYSRENVFHRDGYVCQYCGEKFKRDDLTIDHVIPKSHGGSNLWNNLVCCCDPCNGKKADRTPGQASMRLIREPVEPRWISPLHKVAHGPNMRPGWEKFLGSVGIK